MSDAWRCSSVLSADERLEVLHLLNRTESGIGREAIDEGRRRIVVHGWNAEHWLRYHAAALTDYAMVDNAEPAELEMCGGGVDEDLLTRLLERHHALDWWTRGDQGSVPGAGRIVRTLRMLSAKLPVACVEVPDGAILRNFEPARDERTWLDQNNAAFADHPEQGAWRLRDLEHRTLEPWFDPSGFLLLEIDGRLAASCWTKVHELGPERFGEIYVISVHPDFQRRGLGRVMVTQGLASLRRKGVARAVLFVDESNVDANELYESLGFTLEREDRLWRFELD